MHEFVGEYQMKKYHVDGTWYVDVEKYDDVYYIWLYDVNIPYKMEVAVIEEVQTTVDGEVITIDFDSVLVALEDLFNNEDLDPRSDYMEEFYGLCDGDCDNCPYDDCEDDDEDDDDYNSDYRVDDNIVDFRKNFNNHLLYDESGRPKILF